MPRPVLYVLAGVNGAGKSSVGGHLITHAGQTWYNPDTFARELMRRTDCSQETANGLAWAEGMRRLDAALDGAASYAFETTLGGDTVSAKLLMACATHDVLMWFCGLATPELHLERVRARVAAGGHDIPEAKIRERFVTSKRNLIGLMPHLNELRVFDNSAPADAKGGIPDPRLVLAMQRGRLRHPNPRDLNALAATPDWAKPLVEAAITMHLKPKKT